LWCYTCYSLVLFLAVLFNVHIFHIPTVSSGIELSFWIKYAKALTCCTLYKYEWLYSNMTDVFASHGRGGGIKAFYIMILLLVLQGLYTIYLNVLYRLKPRFALVKDEKTLFFFIFFVFGGLFFMEKGLEWINWIRW